MADRFYDMDDVRRANARRGHHFFESSTLRFFRSRIGTELYGGRYFVTSEQFAPSSGRPAARRYTVREVLPDGSVETVGEFQAYDSGAAARREIQRLLRED